MISNKHIVIIGNGIAGVTLARHLRKRDESVKITLISGESEYFFSRTALMYVFMGHMKFEHTQPYENTFWEKNRLDLIKDWVTKINFKTRELKLESGNTQCYDQLVIATGAKPNFFGWPGQNLRGVQGLYSKQDLELMERNTAHVKNAVIVGGGLIGIEMAEMLAYKKIQTTFLVREAGFWRNILPKEESNLVGRHIAEHHMELKLETELTEIVGDDQGKVKAVITNKGQEIPCQFVGLTAGVSPNIDFLKDSDLEVNRGVLINEKFKTNIPDVFAIGDCAEFHQKPAIDRKNIEQVWYTGRMHGQTLAAILCGVETHYQPGVWFNSAKFLDLEYQTYGYVPADLEAEGLRSFYWEHLNQKVAFRAVMNSDGIIQGVNSFGLRLRHEFFDRAIKEGWKTQKVISKLQMANFDPEFFAPHHISIQESFLREFGGDFKPAKRTFIQKLMGAKL